MKDLGEESFSDDHYRLNFGGVNDAPVETEPTSSLGSWIPPLIEGQTSRPEFGPYMPDLPGEIDIDYTDSIPSDDAIVKQQNSIQAEVAETLQYVGDREPLDSLAAEYSFGNPVFFAKIQNLKRDFDSIRRTRGDGNCFFRGFMLSYLERILVAKDRAEEARVRSRLPYCKTLFNDAGYVQYTWEDFLEAFEEQLDKVSPEAGNSAMSVESLVESCRDANVSNSIVMFFRLVTSCEIQSRREFFDPFTIGTSDVPAVQFSRKFVEPMGEESDHIHITALTDALQIPIRVVYLDRSTPGGENEFSVNHHDFLPEGVLDSAPFVVLLYRPGHYDILYPKKASEAQ